MKHCLLLWLFVQLSISVAAQASESTMTSYVPVADFAQDDIAGGDMRDVVWSFSTAPIGDERYDMSIYPIDASTGVVDGGYYLTFERSDTECILRSIENRMLRVEMDSIVKIFPDSTQRVASSLVGHGITGGRKKLTSSGELSAEYVASGMAVFDDVIINNVSLYRFSGDFELLMTGVDRFNAPAVVGGARMDFNVYVWMADRDPFPLAKRVEYREIGNGFPSPPALMLIASTEHLNAQAYQNTPDDEGTPLQSSDNPLPESLDVDISVVAPGEISITFSDSEGKEYAVKFDIYNSMGQRLAPTVNAICTGAQSTVVVHAVTSQAGAYFVEVSVGNSYSTFKVVQ